MYYMTISKYEESEVPSYNELVEISARWETICDMLDGYEIPEFMLSFPEVRKVADLVQTLKIIRDMPHVDEHDAQRLRNFAKPSIEMETIDEQAKDN